MRPFKIAEGVYSVGVEDWNIRDFHGYETPFGTTYNAFLIMDEKITLIDTVKKEFTGKFIENLSKIVEPGKIDIVISNHTEMDHSGAIPHIMNIVGRDKPLYCSGPGKKNLILHYGDNFNFRAIENGETLSIGKKNLTFLETRMIHWPDSMFTYLHEDKILFSSDGFGQHYAGFETYADQVHHIFGRAKEYFANILLLYAPKIEKLIKGVTELNLNIEKICPDHGMIWRENPEKIIEAYLKWCDQEPKKKAVVLYDTMWKSTKTMAENIAEGISSKGVSTRPMCLKKNSRSKILTKIFDAKGVIVGSPTLNNNMFPTVADFLTYMKGLRPKNKIGAAFGSYGWSGEAVKLINSELEAMKFDLIDTGLKLQYVPDSDGKKKCFAFGEKIGKAIIKNL